ncbi:MAG TPA: DUF2207 domain-containing protein [Pseudolysinimonas sp.]|nr:DUF2207 domain-containing protein [Pseudolysinimonas sp.]
MPKPTRSRLLRALAAAALVFVSLGVPAGAATASNVPAAPASTDDFTFDSFDGVYELSRDDSGRSIVRVTETLVAVFPDFDQNHGPYRVIPATYDGHPTQFHLESITDENGDSWNYEQGYEDDNIYLKIGDADTYVHGTQTYVITYTLKDVTRYFPDTGDDEFYWDTNGLLWAQPFGKVTAHVVLADDLASALSGNAACYYGSEGSTTTCDITETGTGYDAAVSDLGAYQNLSVAIGFTKGTFAPAAFDLFAYVPLPVILGLIASLGGALLALILRFTVLRGARGTGIIVAQYEPQEDLSPLLAANLLRKTKKGMAASIVDLAVRKKIRIVEKPAEGLFASGTTFGVQQLEATDLDADDQKVMNALFATLSIGLLSRLLRSGGATAPGIITLGQQVAAEASTTSGEVRWLTKKDQILGQQVVAITKSVAAEAQSRKLRGKPPGLPILIVTVLVIAGFLLLLFGGMNAQSELGITLGVFGTIIGAWLGIGSLIMLGGQRPLTQAGALAVEHLEGLREYIRLAEADRLQMLQSVTGAERTALDTTAAGGPDVVKVDVIKIYEKLLPYAVLFGLEKEWAGELAKYYDETPPDWYAGSNLTAFNVGAFAAGISGLSSSVSTSFSGSSSSSSSGGSSGGGSSGGGGGGGGGGGW